MTIDLDAKLSFDPNSDVAAQTKKIKLLGREWTMVCDLNFWNLTAAAEDPRALPRLLTGVIAEDERADFSDALGRVKNLTVENLLDIIDVMTTAAAEVPTKRPSASTRGATKRTSSPKSAASSSRRVGAGNR